MLTTLSTGEGGERAGLVQTLAYASPPEGSMSTSQNLIVAAAIGAAAYRVCHGGASQAAPPLAA